MAHTHDVYDMENHFEINGSSRFIKETSETKLVVVQGDHKSEVLTFKMPRYIDGHDMTLCNKIRIHYINIDTRTNNKSADVYEVTDLTLCEECEDVLTFTWTIEAPATKYSGTLSFLVKFECTEGENVLYQWNTAKYVSVNVLDGIDNSEEFVEKYSNVLEEWYNELTKNADSIEELNQQALAEIELAKEDAKEDIENKAASTMAAMNKFSTDTYNSFKNNVDEKAAAALASIPEEYSALDAEVKEQKETLVNLDKEPITRMSDDLTEEYIDGKYYNDSGNLLDSEKLYIGVVRNINNVEKLRCKVYYTQLGYHGFYFWDGENSHAIVASSYDFTVIDAENNIIEIIVPNNATKFTYVNYKTDKDIAYCKGMKPITNFEWLKVTSDNIVDDVKSELENNVLETINTTKSISPLCLNDDLSGGSSDDLTINIIDGKYTLYDGSLGSLASLSCGEVNDIKGGNTYIMKLYANPNNAAGDFVCFLDDNGKGLRDLTTQPYFNFSVIDETQHIYSVVSPKGSVKAKYNFNLSDKDTAFFKQVYTSEDKIDLKWLEVNEENLSDDLKEKLEEKPLLKYGHSIQKPLNFSGKLTAFGDSITAGITSPNLEQTQNSYGKIIADKFDMTFENRAVSGQFICDTESEYSIYNRVLNYTSQTDMIIVAGGCNDYNFGKPLGSYEDNTPTSFYGCLRGICEYLKTNYANATVIFITPINQSRIASTENAIFENSNPYRNAIFEIATSYEFNVVDGSQIGFPIDFEGGFKNYMIADGVHPTEEGHKLYARSLLGILQ